ncbi:3-hydroxyacyl-CoA dehydrogenase NAD-binding domain-containing protein [Streptomyces sp. B6B3]|uniref:3-hydroxyacyl-CoA dehydrogenase NAD-binding domain-containing protein n=1 Tax=Streptomyces sp. B6B3 TaxID=3153570 RepID=UPI00325F3DD9
MPEPTTEQGTFRWHRDADSVVTVALSLVPDAPDAAAAVLAEVADRLAAEIAGAEDAAGNDGAADAGAGDAGLVRGVVLEFGGVEFFSGASLADLTGPRPPDAQRVQDTGLRLKRALRRLETLGPPVVAALTGSALGGGLEIALACHHRIVLDRPGTRLGLPEVTLGLTPAGGGVVRTVRLLGLVDALQKVLLEGRRLSPEGALAAGLVHQVVRSPDELAHQARAFIDDQAQDQPQARQPWDDPDHRIPGGGPREPALAAVLPSFPALLRKRTGGAPYPAPRDILAAAVEGVQVGFATAELIEARYAAHTATGPIARNMTSFTRLDLPAVNAGRSRPRDVPTRAATRVAVLGAGMMGAGIAYACAAAGLEVALKDVDEAAARRGRDRAAQPLDRALARGRITEERRAAILDRITPTARPEDLAGCDVVIEAVFEDPALKQKVFQEVQDLVAPDALLCSNTSTLPVSRLAEGVARPQDFVGLHFFSPVDRMPLVEVVRGERTGDTALARAFDLVRHLGKTPIVVNDARGFFTSRVIGCRLNEGAAMVGEGVEPASVEQASAQAGYPTGVLALLDEVTLTLGRRIRDENRAAAEAAGEPWRPHPAEAVIDRMIDDFGRPGRAAGAGFYDYPEGRRAGLWPGLREHFTEPSVRVPLPDLRDRLLFSEALEAVRLFDRGVVTSVADANVGSLLGLGFPAWTGGVLRFVEGHPGGPAGFVARARELADRYGPRFAPPDALVSRAERGASLSQAG